MVASPISGHFYFGYSGHYHFGVTEFLGLIFEADPARPRFFINEPGVGYRLKVDFDERIN